MNRIKFTGFILSIFLGAIIFIETSSPVLAVDQQKISQSLVSQDGKTSLGRTCNINSNTGQPDPASCTAWQSITLPFSDLDSQGFSGYGAYYYMDNAGQSRVYQSLVSRDGKTSWGRSCALNSGNGSLSGCGSFSQKKVNLLGTGLDANGFSGYDVYHYKNSSGQQKINQTLMSQDGSKSWVRSCLINQGNGETGVCSGWEGPVNLLSLGLDSSGFSSYGAYYFSDNSGQSRIYQSLVSRDGKKSWGRSCGFNTQTEKTASQSCSGWSAVNLTSLNSSGFSGYGGYTFSGQTSSPTTPPNPTSGVQDTIAPVATVQRSNNQSLGNQSLSGYEVGEEVTITFNATDNAGGSGVKSIHTTLVEGVTSKEEAISSGEWSANPPAYKIVSSGSTRIATVPFYLEYAAEDKSKNVQVAQSLLITGPLPAATSTPVPSGVSTPTPTPPSQSVDILLDPAKKSLPVGTDQTLDLTVKLNARSFNIATVEFSLLYDPTKLKFEELINNMEDQGMEIRYTKNELTTPAKVTVSLLRSTEMDNRNISEEVNLTTIKFKLLGQAGEAKVDFGDVQITALNIWGNLTVGQKTGGIYSTSTTTHYRIAETPFAKADDEVRGPKWETFSPTVRYTLKDKSVGVKTIFVQFRNNLNVGSDIFTKSIRYIGSGPLVESIYCGFDSSLGTGSRVEIVGKNFGERGSGGVTVLGEEGSFSAQVLSWGKVLKSTISPTYAVSPTIEDRLTPTIAATTPPTETITPSGTITPSVALTPTIIPSESRDKIVVRVKERLEGAVNVEVTVADGRKVVQSCEVNTNTISFTTKTSCLASGSKALNDVRVQIFEKVDNAKPLFDQKISLDSEGQPSWTASPKLEVGKTYVLLIKAPKAITTKKEFTVSAGTNILEDVQLAIGDIAPLNSPDNAINALDKAELVREWTTTTDVNRPGDFNLDSRINTFDYSCMKENIGKQGERFLSQ